MIFLLSVKGDTSEKIGDKSPTKISDQALNNFFDVENYVSIKDMGAAEPPEHLPEPISNAIRGGATSIATGCWNAAGAMFRLAIDLATAPLLPPEGEVADLNPKTRRDLGLRLPWLFEHGCLPNYLQGLSTCVREDGNDAAHRGTLKKEDALDLLDFTTALLERIYTEPKRIELAEVRRAERRKPQTQK